MAESEPDNGISSTTGSGDGGSQTSTTPISQINTVTITKSEEGSFGLNIVGGMDTPYIPGHHGFFVCRIRRTDLEGKVWEGDRIISVNDIPLEGKTHAEAVSLLKRLEGACKFKIEQNAERVIASGVNSQPDLASRKSTTMSSATSNNNVSNDVDTAMTPDFVTPNTSFANANADTPQLSAAATTATTNISSNSKGGSVPLTPGGSEPDSSSIPSSNASIVSGQSGGGGSRTRTSSTSTITYTAVRNQTGARTGQGWAIDEDGTSMGGGGGTDGTSVAGDEQPETTGTTNTALGSDEAADGGPSLLLELLFVGIGMAAVGAIAVYAFRRLNRASGGGGGSGSGTSQK